MTKFRKLPVEVEAEKFLYAATSWPEGVYESGNRILLRTLEGVMQVTDGDWIVTGIKGERYPVKPDIFAETYELVIDPVDPPEFATTIDPDEVRKPPKGPKLP